MAKFKVNQNELKNYQRNIKNNLPRGLNYAAASMLNSFAFGTRTKAITVIGREMIVRKPSFVRKSLRVTKANGRLDMPQQKAFCGSIYLANTTGWREQELREEPTRTKTIGILARNNIITKIVPGKFRLKKTNKFVDPNDPQFAKFPPSRRAAIMLQMLSKKKYKKPFKILGHRKFAPGLYKFVGTSRKVKTKSGTFDRRDIGRLQKFDNPVMPRPVAWLQMARIEYFSGIDLKAMWHNAISRQVSFGKRKR